MPFARWTPPSTPTPPSRIACAIWPKLLTAARRAVTLATERFDRGLIDSLNVIDAQRVRNTRLSKQYVSAQESAAGQFVTLYKSLGGGWEDYQVFPPIRPPLPAVAAAFRSLLAPNAAP